MGLRLLGVGYCSGTGQGAAKALAVLQAIQATEVFRVWCPRLDVQIDEERSVCL
jgi:hypothetical protein